MDWSERNICIKCNGGGNLLVCSENGCPLAIHEGCMGCPARFDDAGRFYCPYCLYKQAVAESRLAREYALARKKALLVFMDEEMIGGEKHLEENERAEVRGNNQPKVGAVNVNTAICGEGESRRNGDSILDQSIHLDEDDKIRDAEEEKIREEESEISAGSKGQDPSLEMGKDQKISKADRNKIQEVDEESSSACRDQEPSLELHENQKIGNAEERRIQEDEEEISSSSSDQEILHAEEEKIQEEEYETSSSNTDQDPSLEVRGKDKRGSKRKKPLDRDSEAVLTQSKHVKKSDKRKRTPPALIPARRSSRRSSSAMRTKKELNERVDASKKSKQPKKLSEGVRKYAEEGNKNLPWRKILEYGRKVFDETRTPSDLKDKWRNILAK
ncbi:DNA helicase [Handroanthus impetiginosus]|uniref:DNA helicase n=1 Tax=Handroanthus impetiginosus TaxID=429701 RepID=A0A2G9I788_9LAMI|nr:DNA helicase [Handroanthus impetiginosus]